MPIRPRTSNFSVSIRQAGLITLVDVSGHFTSFESAALRSAIESLVKQKRNRIVLNLRNLDYLDSSGVGELVRNYLTIICSGGEMKVVGLSAKIEEILKITQLYKVFP